jgi:hypothetical protein
MITSNQNPKIKHIRRLLSDRRYRHRQAEYVVEGTRWLAELSRQSARPPELILVTETWQKIEEHQKLLQALGAPVTVVSHSSERKCDGCSQRHRNAQRRRSRAGHS